MTKILSNTLRKITRRKSLDYNITQGYVNDSDGVVHMVTYYENPVRGEWGSKIYSGKNYIVGSTNPSYSRNFSKWKGLPEKWRKTLQRLFIQRMH